MGGTPPSMPMLYHLYVIAFVLAIGFAAAFTYTVRNLALRRGWAKPPASERHVHTSAIPRLGGVAIFFTFIPLSCTFFLLVWLSGRISTPYLLSRAYLLLPVTMIFLLGLVDDFRPLGARWKFAVQAFAGILLFAGGFRFNIAAALHHEVAPVIALGLTVGWTVLITNSFNLIDGLDGLAAGSALFSTLAMFVVALAMHNGGIALFTATLAGAIVGFLRYNFNPATIFLGDCGSQFLGFMLATLSLAGTTQQKSSTIIAVAIPIVAFGFPIIETAISILRRFISGQPIFGADRQHIHHKLMALGFSQRSAVALLYVISAGFGLLSLVLLSPGSAPIAIVLSVVGIGIAVGVQHLNYHEFFEIGRIARRTLDQKQIILNNLLIRRASESLWSATQFEHVRSALDSAFAENAFDGFDLTLYAHQSGRRLTHAWDRTGASASVWSITIDLLDDSGRRAGELTVKRCRQTHLHVDINLLCAELVPALVTAARRIQPHQVPVEIAQRGVRSAPVVSEA